MSSNEDLTISSDCRLCGADGLRPVLDYGETPLANALLPSAKPTAAERTYPLSLVFCPNCSLIQIRETIRSEILFSNYPYFSSNSPSFVAAARDLAHKLIRTKDLDGTSLVVEAASNDGYLLQHYVAKGIPVLGIEPAANVAAAADARGVRTRVAFFGLETARTIVGETGKAKVFHANNVLAHVPSLHSFVAGVAHLLQPDGVAIFEVPYAGTFVAKCEFDTVYHEHLCYFSLTALVRLMAMNGLQVIDVEHLPTHGGSLRVFAAHPEREKVDDHVTKLLLAEEESGLISADRLADFGDRAQVIAARLKELITSLRAKGKSVAAYGASAKGATLLNFARIGAELIDFVADRSPAKRGKLMPGAHLPIVGPDALYERGPDFAVLLAWNFLEEILEQQKAYTLAGGRFIVPIPAPRIVDRV